MMAKFITATALLLLAAYWTAAAPESLKAATANVTTVYLVSSCHLDVDLRTPLPT